GAQLVGNAFRVVQPVDSDAQDFGGASQLGFPLFYCRLHFRTVRAPLVLVEIDADREGANGGQVIASLHATVLAIDQPLNVPIDCIEKVRAVMAEVESEEI